MNHSPEDLEKLIHRTLRSLPDRRAPQTLEGRVLAAIEARQALPWWRRSYSAWPLAARCMFLLLSGTAAILLVAGWTRSGIHAPDLSASFASELALLEGLRSLGRAAVELGALVFRSIPPVWLYGGLACLAALYAMLLGVGATAYRTLYGNR